MKFIKAKNYRTPEFILISLFTLAPINLKSFAQTQLPNIDNTSTATTEKNENRLGKVTSIKKGKAVVKATSTLPAKNTRVTFIDPSTLENLASGKVFRLLKSSNRFVTKISSMKDGITRKSLIGKIVVGNTQKKATKGPNHFEIAGTIVKVKKNKAIVNFRKKQKLTVIGENVYVVNEPQDKIIAKLKVTDLTKSRKRALTEIIRTVDGIESMDLKDSKFLSQNIAKEKYPTSPLLIDENVKNNNQILSIDVGFGVFDYITASLVYGEGFEQQMPTLKYKIEAYLPNISGLEWTNWIGLSYQASEYAGAEIEFIGQTTAEKKLLSLNGSESNLDLSFKPTFSNRFLKNLFINYSILYTRSESVNDQTEDTTTESSISISDPLITLGLTISIIDNLELLLSYMISNATYEFSSNSYNTISGNSWNRRDISMQMSYDFPIYSGNLDIMLTLGGNGSLRSEAAEALSIGTPQIEIDSFSYSAFLGMKLLKF